MVSIEDVLRQRLKWKSFLLALQQKDWNVKRVRRPTVALIFFQKIRYSRALITFLVWQPIKSFVLKTSIYE